MHRQAWSEQGPRTPTAAGADAAARAAWSAADGPGVPRAFILLALLVGFGIGREGTLFLQAFENSAGQEAAAYECASLSAKLVNQVRALQRAQSEVGPQAQRLAALASAVQAVSNGSAAARESFSGVAQAVADVQQDVKAVARRQKRCRKATAAKGKKRPAATAPGSDGVWGRRMLSLNSRVGVHSVSVARLDATLLTLAPHGGGPASPAASGGAPLDSRAAERMLARVRPGSTVVDAACGVGAYAVFFAAKAGPLGTVHCFEPRPELAQFAAANAVANAVQDIVTVHSSALAATARSPAADSPHPGPGPPCPSACKGAAPLRPGAGAAAVTLDALQLDRVSLIRVDMHESGRLALYGARETIRHGLPWVAYGSPHSELGSGSGSDSGSNSDKSSAATGASAVPQEGLDWSPDDFLQSLGYTQRRDGDLVMHEPPARRPAGDAEEGEPEAAGAAEEGSGAPDGRAPSWQDSEADGGDGPADGAEAGLGDGWAVY